MTRGSELRRLAVVGVLLSSQAFADTAAEKAFAEGRDLFRAGKFSEACLRFEQSEQLDPQMGTLFNLAQCDEKVGKLASAIVAYREVVAKDTNAKRKALAAEYAVTLGQRVPKLVVAVVDPPAGLVVTLDQKPVETNQPIEIDFGDHVIAATADGFRRFERKVKIDQENKTTSVPITLQGVDTKPTTNERPAEPPQPPEPPVGHSHRKTYGFVALGFGGAAVVGGVVFGVLARGKWNDAKAVCGGTVCPTQPLVDQANALADEAHSKGNISSALVISGGVIAAVGAYLVVSAPSEHDVQVHAVIDRSMTGAVIAGRF